MTKNITINFGGERGNPLSIRIIRHKHLAGHFISHCINVAITQNFGSDRSDLLFLSLVKFQRESEVVRKFLQNIIYLV
jgi:hypothetical protein